MSHLPSLYLCRVLFSSMRSEEIIAPTIRRFGRPVRSKLEDTTATQQSLLLHVQLFIVPVGVRCLHTHHGGSSIAGLEVSAQAVARAGLKRAD